MTNVLLTLRCCQGILAIIAELDGASNLDAKYLMLSRQILLIGAGVTAPRTATPSQSSRGSPSRSGKGSPPRASVPPLDLASHFVPGSNVEVGDCPAVAVQSQPQFAMLLPVPCDIDHLTGQSILLTTLASCSRRRSFRTMMTREWAWRDRALGAAVAGKGFHACLTAQHRTRVQRTHLKSCIAAMCTTCKAISWAPRRCVLGISTDFQSSFSHLGQYESKG